MIINSTLITRGDDLYYYADSFPLPYEDEEWNMDSSNRTFYDDYILNSNNQTLNLTTTDVFSYTSVFSFSSPFSYILLILIVYSILTLILLSLSLYKQRRTEIENFHFGDTDEEIERTKRSLVWKQLLINRISKGDMEPLLTTDSNDIHSESQITTFPLHIV
ncbi:hypothetical protein I4U23_006235 [Adineta vaga]|nr:hypothetical protein I4U23_006235 [Adineta vaga]